MERPGLDRGAIERFLADLDRRTAPARAAREAQMAILNPKRYEIIDGELFEDSEGSLVMYEAHKACVAKVEKEAHESGYSSGHSSATDRSCSWRD